MLDEETRERVEKLPTWARNTIRKLDLDCDRLRKELNEMAGEVSPIWHTPDYQTKLCLPKWTTVVFKLEQGEVEFELHEEQIKVFANGRGRQGNARLCILPEITNAFIIGFKEG